MSEHSEEELEVEAILGRRSRKGQIQYLLQWKNCDENSDSWEPEDNLHCPELLEEFLRKQRKLRYSKLKLYRRQSNKRPVNPESSLHVPEADVEDNYLSASQVNAVYVPSTIELQSSNISVEANKNEFSDISPMRKTAKRKRKVSLNCSVLLSRLSDEEYLSVSTNTSPVASSSNKKRSNKKIKYEDSEPCIAVSSTVLPPIFKVEYKNMCYGETVNEGVEVKFCKTERNLHDLRKYLQTEDDNNDSVLNSTKEEYTKTDLSADITILEEDMIDFYIEDLEKNITSSMHHGNNNNKVLHHQELPINGWQQEFQNFVNQQMLAQENECFLSTICHQQSTKMNNNNVIQYQDEDIGADLHNCCSSSTETIKCQQCMASINDQLEDCNNSMASLQIINSNHVESQPIKDSTSAS